MNECNKDSKQINVMKIIMKYDGVYNHDTPHRNIPHCFYLMLHILITKNI